MLAPIFSFMPYPTAQFFPKCNWWSKWEVPLRLIQFFFPCKFSSHSFLPRHSDSHSLGIDTGEGGTERESVERNPGMLISQRMSSGPYVRNRTVSSDQEGKKLEWGTKSNGGGDRVRSRNVDALTLFSYFLYLDALAAGDSLIRKRSSASGLANSLR